MNLRKRTFALLLTLCMLLSVVVPMASAEEEAITISLGTEYVPVQLTASGMSPKSTFLLYDSCFRVNFKTTDSANGGWAAIRIPGNTVPQGTYAFQMAAPATSQAGLADVYILKDTTATGDALTAYITENMNKSTYQGKYDSSKAGVTNIQDLGKVSMDGKDFILVFKDCPDQSGNHYAYVARMFFTPVAGEGGSTVTPPAGGEGGSTVTPPAGGEGSGTVTPPVDTPPQTGDASPVLFAVMALAASLIAMVALIPGKKRA